MSVNISTTPANMQQATEVIKLLDDKVTELENDILSLREDISTLEFKLECLPDVEHDTDNELDNDLFMILEQLINRLGYIAFQQLLDAQMGKIEKYYGEMKYLRVR